MTTLDALDRLTWRELAGAGLIAAGEAGRADWTAWRSNPARWLRRLDAADLAALQRLLDRSPPDWPVKSRQVKAARWPAVMTSRSASVTVGQPAAADGDWS